MAVCKVKLDIRSGIICSNLQGEASWRQKERMGGYGICISNNISPLYCLHEYYIRNETTVTDTRIHGSAILFSCNRSSIETYDCTDHLS